MVREHLLAERLRDLHSAWRELAQVSIAEGREYRAIAAAVDSPIHDLLSHIDNWDESPRAPYAPSAAIVWETIGTMYDSVIREWRENAFPSGGVSVIEAPYLMAYLLENGETVRLYPNTVERLELRVEPSAVLAGRFGSVWLQVFSQSYLIGKGQLKSKFFRLCRATAVALGLGENVCLLFEEMWYRYALEHGQVGYLHEKWLAERWPTVPAEFHEFVASHFDPDDGLTAEHWVGPFAIWTFPADLITLGARLIEDHLAGNNSDNLEPLTETQQRADTYIRQNPGKVGKEIAAALDIPEGTFSNHVAKALRAKRGLKNRRGYGYYYDGTNAEPR